ncbi:hypothetical protein DERP_008574 [Dermatophagoides pteronyssinus]|uniref:Uncharacterized protein n=1 Tax=Dermatophagoides pteronyssinus TaxID=6956 RepID=A0ABQ8IWR2_DERPT|nr:hypothetical protein DERP_008574 [Dermatophagoides pteronyssinus]
MFKLATIAKRSGSLPPPQSGRMLNNHRTNVICSTTTTTSSLSPLNSSLNTTKSSSSSASTSASTGNLLQHTRQACYKMSYVLISTDDFHRGPTRISTIDPYLHEKVPFTVIKDSLYFQAEPQYDPHGRYWKFRVEDAPVRVLNKLLDLGYKVLTGTSLSSTYEHNKQPGHAWTLFRDPNVRYSIMHTK